MDEITRSERKNYEAKYKARISVQGNKETLKRTAILRVYMYMCPAMI